MTSAPLDELERAQDGDAEAFRMLVREHSHKMFRLAYRMTGSEQDAEDIVQETFLRAYRHLGEYESRAHFASWLHRIAANCALDLLRRRKRWRSSDLDTHEKHSPLESSDPRQDQEVFGAEVHRRVQETLEQLSEKERVAFTLRHYEGLSIQQIGDVLGSGTSATKNHVFRAVQKMRKALRPLVDASGGLPQ